jgi:hypothetical protein
MAQKSRLDSQSQFYGEHKFLFDYVNDVAENRWFGKEQ